MIRILLVEDDQAMRAHLSKMLSQAGYSIVALDKAEAALPHLRNADFDLLLTDITLPGMDGIELAQHCADLSPMTRIMFITGFAAVSLRVSREAPHNKVLSKPFHLRNLPYEVQQMFDLPEQATL